MNRLLITAALLLGCNLALAEYSKSKDDFSNGYIHKFRKDSNDGNAAILISCFPSKEIQVQLVTSVVIFPDDSNDSGMVVVITHKFDTAPKAHRASWDMNMMKYNNAWYSGSAMNFLTEAIKSETLAIRLDKNGDVFKFDLSNEKGNLIKVGKACI